MIGGLMSDKFKGTAKDLDFPFFGPLFLFIRGAQRSIWGFCTLWTDLQVFSGTWNIPDIPPLFWTFLLNNVLVLSFLFGERALMNLEPMITRVVEHVWGKKNAE